MRSLAVCGLLIVSTVGVACGDLETGEKESAAAREDSKAPGRAVEQAAAEPPAPAPLPPAPQGSLTLADPPLFVQTCEDAHPCPSLLQREGEQHCAKLTLGSAHAWRLPTREEVGRMRGQAGLSALEGYHWTSTAFDQDEAQVWIVDPSSDQPTTVPRDRKPFRIRCVKQP